MVLVTDSALKMSLGAGRADHMKFGIMTATNNNSAPISKPNLYFLAMGSPFLQIYNIDSKPDEISFFDWGSG